MAVTAAFKRIKHTLTVPVFDEFCTATLSGTYATGGFTWSPFAITSTLGSSPIPASAVLAVDFYSPEGYIYVTSVSGQTATTKIFSAPNTELANTTAVPDASITVVIAKAK